MRIVFWLSILGVMYTYLGYPLALFLVSRIRSREIKLDDAYLPNVTLIVTVHNEAGRIERKIANTLEIKYPQEKFEIIFASDASTDGTDAIVRQYSNNGIKLVRAPYRGGKEFAQKCATKQAKGEIFVFSDVATMLQYDGIMKIVSNFADLSVGCVSGEDRFIDDRGRVSGEGAYVKYEMWLRSLETRLNSVVGLSGSFFAARKVVCRNWPTSIPSDFNTLFNSIRYGLRGISDPCSIGLYPNIRDERQEYNRKVRTITRGISALISNISLLNPFKYGLFSWQLFSHKLMRWLVPVFLAVALIANAVLAVDSLFYLLLIIPHLSFYLLSFLGRTSTERSAIYKIPFYFIQVNLAISVAWIKYFCGEHFVAWAPSQR